MSDRFNIEIMDHKDRFRFGLRDLHDSRYNLDFIMENWDSEYSAEALYSQIKEQLLQEGFDLIDEWYSLGICDGMTEIRVDKENRKFTRIDWYPDYKGQTVFIP